MSFRTLHRIAVAASVLASVAAGLAVVPAPLAAATQKSAGRDATAVAIPVDLNRATAEELEALPGIGPVTARRIVDFREEHGPFRRVEDLMKVKGIGEKSFQKLRDRVRVSSDD